MSKNSLKIADVPFLMAQWSSKNTEDPAKIAATSSKVCFWECHICGYDWSVSAKARFASGGKCPCHETNKVIVPGINDVLTLMPELKAYYDTEKNEAEGIDISHEGFDSSVVVNWKCPECGRCWKSTIRSRTSKKDGIRVIIPCPHYNTVKRKSEDIPTVAQVPAMMRLWDISRNPDAATVKSNSPEYAFWLCPECGYDWRTTVVSLARGGCKCPCCESNTAIKSGINDLFTLIPEAKRFYDFEKNAGVDIYSIGIRNGEPLWWTCPDCGNSWKSPIAARVEGKKGSYRFRGCQQCYFTNKDRITPASSNKIVVKYWDYERNKGIDINLTSLYSEETVHWRCKDCDLEWDGTIKGMITSKGCPYCNNPEGYFDHYPYLMESLYKIFVPAENPHIDLPKTKLFSKTEVFFHCHNCGHEWSGPLGNRISKDNGTYRVLGCPKCDNNSLRRITYAEQYPDLAAMYNARVSGRPLSSITSYECNTIKLAWDCPICNETFVSRVRSMITARDTSSKGCPYCSHTLLRKGESFGDLHPELLREYSTENVQDPFKVFPCCEDDVIWQCLNNPEHIWHASFSVRHSGYGNCPICNRTQRIKGVNTFADVYPEYLDMYSDNNERKPDDIFYNSVLWFWWNCRTCHGEFGAYIKDVVSGEECCPYCKGIRALPGVNSLQALYPDIAARYSLKNPHTADEVLPTSTSYHLWDCPDCGGEYNALMADVVSGEHTCPYCNDRMVLPGFNDFATRHPDLMGEYDYITNYIFTDSDKISERSFEPLWWICSRNPEHRYLISPRKRLWFQMRHREPCPYCKGRRYKKLHF
ncbi:MAG: zinc-ribbon domain-containing protein [Lachnospiraceae bacterium]|nr:zinc-ribbon domain-containing protein [Lachnospiraceae bacterium]